MMVRWLTMNESIKDLLKNENFRGFLINQQVTTRLARFVSKIFFQSGRHWTCIRKGK
jgi:hypothetical protein